MLKISESAVQRYVCAISLDLTPQQNMHLTSLADIVSSAALQEIDPLEPIELELDPEDDAAVASWFYDDKPLQWTKFVNGPSYRSWNLPLPVVSTCCSVWRAAVNLLLQISHPVAAAILCMLLRRQVEAQLQSSFLASGCR